MQDRWMDWLAQAPAGRLSALRRRRPGAARHATARRSEPAYVPDRGQRRRLLGMLDKERTHELAARAGIPAPRTLSVRTQDDLAARGRSPTRARSSRCTRTSSGATSRLKAFVVARRGRAARALRRQSRSGVEMIGDRDHPGPRRPVPLATTPTSTRPAEPLFTFTKRKLRQYPIRFGLRLLPRHGLATPRSRSSACASARASGLRGLVNVEFKRDARDGA